ncbi:uncharacterized protein WM277_006394 [Molossus nigricans]
MPPSSWALLLRHAVLTLHAGRSHTLTSPPPIPRPPRSAQWSHVLCIYHIAADFDFPGGPGDCTCPPGTPSWAGGGDPSLWRPLGALLWSGRWGPSPLIAGGHQQTVPCCILNSNRPVHPGWGIDCQEGRLALDPWASWIKGTPREGTLPLIEVTPSASEVCFHTEPASGNYLVGNGVRLGLAGTVLLILVAILTEAWHSQLRSSQGPQGWRQEDTHQRDETPGPSGGPCPSRRGSPWSPGDPLGRAVRSWGSVSGLQGLAPGPS